MNISIKPSQIFTYAMNTVVSLPSTHRTKKITFTEFEKYLDEISKSKKVDAGSIRNKLKDCGAPGTSGTTVSSILYYTTLHRLDQDSEAILAPP